VRAATSAASWSTGSSQGREVAALVRIPGKVYESDFVHLVTLQSDRVTKFQEFFDTYAAGEAFRSRLPDQRSREWTAAAMRMMTPPRASWRELSIGCEI